jgi:hypothetical protein
MWQYHPLVIKDICEVINYSLIILIIYYHYKLDPKTWETLFFNLYYLL